MIMFHAYILLSLKDNRTYVGYTKNLSRRLDLHNSGQVISTKHRLPFRILFAEKFETRQEAQKRERYWKSGGGRRKLKKMIATTELN
jgi:putative endonuclease